MDEDRGGGDPVEGVETSGAAGGGPPGARRVGRVYMSDRAALEAEVQPASARFVRGRGAVANPEGRFERFHYEDAEAGQDEDPLPGPATQLLRDPTREIFSHNDSPDLGFDTSINPYRGCEHGCSYCYARPTHEYLGFSAGLDFETRIFVKEDAAEKLRRRFGRPSYRPTAIALSGVTDPYQPAERKLHITRSLLEVFLEFRNPVTIVTKSASVTRDVDLLAELAQHNLVSVAISVTTLDRELQQRMEPRASAPRKRLRAISELRSAGVPVGGMVAPVIPGLTHHEIPSLVEAIADAGGQWAGYVLLRLPHGLAELFSRWLGKHVPERKDKVLSQIKAMRGGRLYDSRFGRRKRGEGFFADSIEQLFHNSLNRYGLETSGPKLSIDRFRRSGGSQMDLFETNDPSN